MSITTMYAYVVVGIKFDKKDVTTKVKQYGCRGTSVRNTLSERQIT